MSHRSASQQEPSQNRTCLKERGMPVANAWGTLEASFVTMKLKTVETKVRCPHPYRATRHMLQCTLMCPLMYTEVSDPRSAFVVLWVCWLAVHCGPFSIRAVCTDFKLDGNISLKLAHKLGSLSRLKPKRTAPMLRGPHSTASQPSILELTVQVMLRRRPVSSHKGLSMAWETT